MKTNPDARKFSWAALAAFALACLLALAHASVTTRGDARVAFDGDAGAESYATREGRLRPTYPDAASRAEAEATVDASVEIGADGEVGRVEIVRWAGFGLDDSVVSTIRQMHFRPATRDGEAVAVRVLLRYNFRKPTAPK